MSIFLQTPTVIGDLASRQGLGRIEPRAWVKLDDIGSATGAGGRIAKNRSDAIITSGKVSIEGDFGSLIKAEIQLELYNMSALETLDAAYYPGKDCTVSYGYNSGLTPPGSLPTGGGSYDMTVYDFSYQWHPDGPSNFNVTATVKAVGSGQFLSKVNAATAVTPNGREFNAAYRDTNVAVAVSTIWDVFDYDLQEASGQRTGKSGFEPEDGWYSTVRGGHMASFKAPDGYESPDPGMLARSALTLGIGSVDAYVSYCSLSYIINTLLNQEILDNGEAIGTFMASKRYTFDPTVEQASGYSWMFSADPISILFPGANMDYCTDNADDEGKDFAIGQAANLPKVNNGDSPANLKNVMISRDFLKSIQKDMNKGEKDDADTGKTDTSKMNISKFLEKIFAKIKQCSGGVYSLGIQLQPDNQNEILIVCTNPVPEVPGEAEFNIYDDWNVLDISLTSKIPSDMAAEAFARGAAGTGDEDAKAAVGVTKEETEVVGVTDLSKAETIRTVTFPEDSFGEDAQKAAIGIIKAIIAGQTATQTVEKSLKVYPLDLNIKLRGIHGFRFGDAITTNFLPSRYKTADAGIKLVFTVLRVTQNISDGFWTTDLKTICRLVPG